jgi:aminotransferase
MKYGVDSNTFCERLLSEAKVAVVPGSAFGNGGEGFVRISYSYSMNELSEGFNRLENWIINNFE